MRFARVPSWIAIQSMRPKTAAASPVITPAAIMWYDEAAHPGRSRTSQTMSKTTAIASRPSGKTISIWWIGWPSSFAFASMRPP
jgi:hypothetical protein